MAIDFEKCKETRFEGLTHAELRECGTLLGVHFGSGTPEHVMRMRLCEKLGEGIPPAPPEAPAPPSADKPKPVKMVRMQRPRLAPGDVWEGRKRDVTVNNTAETAGQRAFVLYWNAFPKAFPYNRRISIPQPYWEILSSCKVWTVTQEPIFNKLNQLESMERVETSTPRFSYTDHGWTPGTENKPGSILEYWQNEAKDKQYFRSLLKNERGRNTLIQIRSDLIGGAGPAYYKDRTNEDIWHEIMQFCGFEDLFYSEEFLDDEAA